MRECTMVTYKLNINKLCVVMWVWILNFQANMLILYRETGCYSRDLQQQENIFFNELPKNKERWERDKICIEGN